MRVNVYRSMLLLVALAACSADKAVTAPSESRDMVAEKLAHLADSVSIASDDANAAPYRVLAELARVTEQPPSVRIKVDGEVLPFSAVAHETMITVPCANASVAGSTTTSECPRHTRVRMLLAWHQPTRRMLLLSTSEEQGTFGTLGANVPLVSPVLLRFFDQDGHASVATAGTFASSLRTYAECPVDGRFERKNAQAECSFAHFEWALDATTERRDVGRAATDTVAPAHTLALAPSRVQGTQWMVTAPPPPPAPPAASPLAVTLRSRVDSVVTFALVVRNRSDAPLDLRFPTSQQFDFAVAERGGKTVWRWSDGKTFSAEPMIRTIPAHDSIVFTAPWMPTVRGELIVQATMTSATQRVSTRAALLVPLGATAAADDARP